MNLAMSAGGATLRLLKGEYGVNKVYVQEASGAHGIVVFFVGDQLQASNPARFCQVVKTKQNVTKPSPCRPVPVGLAAYQCTKPIGWAALLLADLSICLSFKTDQPSVHPSIHVPASPSKRCPSLSAGLSVPSSVCLSFLSPNHPSDCVPRHRTCSSCRTSRFPGRWRACRTHARSAPYWQPSSRGRHLRLP
jgi:hypothetical protein